MTWGKLYDEKFMTAEEAAKLINSGDVVWVGALSTADCGCCHGSI